MRRSTKLTLASAFGIALVAAQVGPYVTQRGAEYGKRIEKRRIIRAHRLVTKLEMVKNDPAPLSTVFEWLLIWVDDVISSAYLSQIQRSPPSEESEEIY